MINCTLTSDQVRAFRVKVAGDLLDIQKDPTKTFDLKSYTKDIYNLVLNNAKDKNLAIEYGRLTPLIIVQLMSKPLKFGGLRKKGLDVVQLYDRTELFSNEETGFDEAVKYLDVAKTEEEQLEKEVLEIEVEAEKEKVKEKEIKKSLPANRKPDNPISTTIDELLVKGDDSQGSDPEMVYYTNFVKNILVNKLNNRVSSSPLSGINYPGAEGGLFVTLMRYNQIPKEQLHPNFSKNLSINEKRYADEFVYVVTDGTGKPLFFDSQYNVSNSGKIIYYNSRFLPSKKQDGKFNLTNVLNVQTPEEYAKNNGVSVEDAENILNGKFEFLETLYKYLTENPKGFVKFSIETGSLGATVDKRASWMSPERLNSAGRTTSLEILTSEKAKEVTGSPNAVGGLYLNIGISKPLPVRRKKLSTEDVTMLVDLLTTRIVNPSGNIITDRTKEAIIKSIVHSTPNNKGNLSIKIEDEKLIITYKGEKLDFTNKEKVRTAFAEETYFVKKLTINNQLDYTTYSLEKDDRTGDNVLRVGKITSKEYFSKVAEIKTELDANNEIKLYNPYFELLPAESELNKISQLAEEKQDVPTFTGVPQDVSAKYDLVNTYGYDQNVVDKMTTSEILEAYKKESSKEKKEDISPEIFNSKKHSEKKQILIDYLKAGKKITGSIKKITGGTTGYIFTTPKGSNFIFYNNQQDILSEDINKTAELVFKEEVISEDKLYTNVVQVYVGDKFIGNVRETDEFQKSKEQQEVIEKAEEVTNETESNTPVDSANAFLDNLLKSPDAEDFLKGIKNKLDRQTNLKATAEQIKDALEWYKSSPLSKYVPFHVMFGAINTKTPGSIASWDVNGITLWKGSNYSDLYHEAWHGFTQLFLNKEQKQKLYGEARKRKGAFVSFLGRETTYGNATLEELEEVLAEEFREYVLSKGTKVDEKSPVKKSIFKWLFDLLAQLFGKSSVNNIVDNGSNNSVIHEYYEKLRVGDLNEFTFNESNRVFSALNKTLTTLDNGFEEPHTLSKTDAKLLVDSTDALFGEFILSLVKRDRRYFGYYKTKAGRAAAYKYVNLKFTEKLESDLKEREKILAERTDLKSKYEDMDTTALDEKIKDLGYNIELLSYALRHFGEPDNFQNTFGLVEYHNKISTFLEMQDIVDDYADPNLYLKNEFEKNSGADISMKDLASNNLLFLIKILNKTDKKGNVKTNKLGFSELENFRSAFTRFTNTTEGSITIDDVYEKLNSVKEDYPIFQQLLNILGSPQESVSSPDLMSIWSDIEKIVTMPRIPLIRAIISITEKSINDKIVRDTFQTASLATGEFSKVGQSWNNQFSIRNTDRYTRVSDENETTLNIDNVLKDYPSVESITEDTFYKFMEAVGMPLEESTIAKNQAWVKEEIKKDIINVYRTLTQIKKYNDQFSEKIIISKPADIFKDYKNFLRDNSEVRAKLQTEKIEIDNLIKGLSGSSKSWNAIQKFQLKWSPDFSDTTVSNAENQNQQEKSLRSTVTQEISKINAATSISDLTKSGNEDVSEDFSMNHYDPERNPFIATSVYMKRLFDLRGKGVKFRGARIEIQNMSGFQRELTNVKGIITRAGISSSSADPISKTLQDLYMTMLHGVAEGTRTSDKSTTYLYRAVSSNDKAHPINPGLFLMNNGLDGYNEFIKILQGYFDSEVGRIYALKNGDPSGNTLVGDTTYKEVGSKFVIFDGILNISKQEINDNLNRFSSAQSFLEELRSNATLRDNLQKDIGNYIIKKAGEYRRVLNQIQFFENPSLYNSIIQKMLNEYNSTVGFQQRLTRSMLTREDIASFIEQIPLAYIANDWIHKYESTILFNGDPALYKGGNVDEFFKRNSGSTSTGEFPRIDKYMLQFVNDYINKASYAKVKGYEPKRFSRTMNAAVMEDPITPSVYLKELVSSAQETERKRLEKLKKSETEINVALQTIKRIYEKSYGKMKAADGQGYITFDSYRSLLISLNKWTKDQENLYNKIINGENIDTITILNFFPVKKMQYYGPLFTEGLPVYGFHKYSLLPLIPNLVKEGTNLEILHTKMMEQQIDYSLFTSGSKVNTVTKNGKADKFYENFDNPANTSLELSKPDYEFTKNTIFLDYFKDQTEVPSVYKGKNTFSTQLRKLVEEGLFENGVPTDWKIEVTDKNERYNLWQSSSEKEKAVSKNYNTAKTYEALLEKLVDLKKKELKQQLKSKNKEEIVEFIRKELSKRDLADNEIDFIDYDFKTKNFKYPLDLSLSAEIIEKALVAVIQKRLINLKATGESLVQVSGVGFEKNEGLRSATEEEQKQYGTRGLRFYKKGVNKTSAMKIKISMQGSFKELLKLKDVKNLVREGITPLDALNSLLKNEEWLDSSGVRQMITSVAVRIPVQGLNSMEFMEVYEFLPESSGNIVILPEEIVAKSGGDFDIDKMFTLFPSLISDENDNVSLASGNNIAAVENDLIGVMTDILSMPDNYVRLTMPNTTEDLEEVAKEMSGFIRQTKVKSPTSIFEYSTNLYKQQSNSVGKAVLGIIAVVNTFSTIFKRTGLVLNPDATLSTDTNGTVNTYRQRLFVPHNQINGNISLSNIYSQDNLKMISDTISQMINGAVDVAKDAWIFDIQGNKELINALTFMIMAGVPARHAVLLLSQPMIRDYVREVQRQKSVANEAIGIEDPGNYFRTKGRDEILRKGGFNIDFESIINKKNTRSLSYVKAGLFKEFGKIVDQNKELLSLENLESNIQSKEYTDTDRVAFAHFNEIMEMATRVTNLTQTLNFDTSKTSTILDARLKEDKIEELSDGFPKDSIRKIIDESPISGFRIQEFIIDVLGDMFPLRDNVKVTDNIVKMLKHIPGKGSELSKIERITGLKKDSLLRLWRNDLISYIFQQSYYNIDPITDSYSGMSVEYIPSLDSGVAIKDNVIYVSRIGIEKLYSTSRYKNVFEEYRSSKSDLPIRLFTKFLIEKEIQSQFEENSFEIISKTTDYENYYNQAEKNNIENPDLFAYEEVMADKVMDSMNLHQHLFKGLTSYPAKVMRLKDTHPELFNEYSILNSLELTTSGKGLNRIFNLKLKGNPDNQTKNVFNEELEKLADMNVIKDKDPIENKRISDLFARFTVFALIQSGIDTRSSFSLIRFASNEKYIRLIEEPFKQFLKSDNIEEQLSEYTELFKLQYSLKNWEFKNKIKNYVAKDRIVAALPNASIYDSEEVSAITQPSTQSTVQPVDEIAIPTRSSKKESYKLTTAEGNVLEREGYKINISEFPNTQFYIYKDNQKNWQIDDLTTGLAFPIRALYGNTINKVLEEFTETVNKLAKGPNNLKVLQTTGLFVTTQPSTQQQAEVKEGVSELFDSNPELANQVYEALGFNTNAIELDIENVITNKLKEKIFKIGKIPFEKIELQDVNVHIKKKSDNEFSIAVDNKGTNIFGLVSAVLDFQKRDLDSNSIYSPNPNGFILWNTFLKSEVAGMAKSKSIIDNRFSISLGALKALRNNGIEFINFPERFFENFKTEYSQFLKQEFSSVGFTDTKDVRLKTIEISMDDLIQIISLKKEIENSKIEITPQQKQQALQAYSQYLEQNPNGDIEGFKKFTTQPSTTGEQLASEGSIFKNPQIDFKVERLNTQIGQFEKSLVFSYVKKGKEFLTKTEVAKLISYYPNAVFVYNEILNPKNTDPIEKTNTVFRSLGENSFGLTTKKGINPINKEFTNDKPAFNKLNVLSDSTLEENKKIIDQQIRELLNKKEQGSILIFDKNGYGQTMIGYSEMQPGVKIEDYFPAPQTFKYLSEQLLKNFGYINPNYIRTQEGKIVIQSLSPISDREVLEFKLNCLRRK